MKKYAYLGFLCFIMAWTIAFSGCAKDDKPLLPETSAPVFEESIQSSTPTSETPKISPTLTSEPGTLGTHIIATTDIEAGEDVLDNVSATLPDGVTRQTVSNIQHDFIKNGKQVGGILLLDIPGDILEKAAKTYEGAEELADYIANQIMSDAYPAKISFEGGGKPDSFDGYIFLTFYDQNTTYTYPHYLYVGESYCYDLWFDDYYFSDSGATIINTLVCEDIKPELNEPEYGWEIVNGELITK